MIYRTINPTTEEEVARFELHTDDAVGGMLDASARAFGTWRRSPVSERAEMLDGAAHLLEQEAGSLAELMAVEMGKPLAQGEAEARKSAWACRFYAERAESFLEPEPRESDGSESFVRLEPLGPILAIMPWNFPLWQFYRFAAPALTAGNTVLLKHSPNTPQCALAIELLMRRAGFPPGVIQNLFLTHEQATAVISDSRVRGVTLTGSTRAGREVARAAGRNLKPAVMELGGSDPFIVFDDADLDEAARIGVDARCLNNGQSCIAAKRFLVERSVVDAFGQRFVGGMEARIVGAPTLPETEIGPLARRDLREILAAQVDRTISAGARVLCGGVPGEGRGYFYPPTVLADVPAESPAATEELFGPVATLTVFDTEDEAIEIANSTNYGLGASLWTADPDRARRLIPEIEAGSVFVNGMVKSDPRLPFGGVKESGFGRELSREGLLEFINLKTVWIA
jgi:succinate-semialdehyde dehydrogenase/glutarate-semialdehyde dehydrogenase